MRGKRICVCYLSCVCIAKKNLLCVLCVSCVGPSVDNEFCVILCVKSEPFDVFCIKKMCIWHKSIALVIN